MMQMNHLIEQGSVSCSEHFELTFVSGEQKRDLGGFWNVIRINSAFIRKIIAVLEHEPDTLCSFEQRLQGSIRFYERVNPGRGLLRISVTWDEGCCSLLPHGMWKGLNISFNDTYSTTLQFAVRKKVQLRSLVKLTSIIVAECLLQESDCNLLEVPQDLIPDIRSEFQSCWSPRSHRVNMHGGSRQLCKEHVECASCICSSKS